MLPVADYKIFLDDERQPAFPNQDAIICRSFWDFKKTICDFGVPKYISFDHDLGDPDPSYNGKKCAEFLIMMIEKDDVDVRGFTYDVHSQNPIGAANIHGYLKKWLEYLVSEY